MNQVLFYVAAFTSLALFFLALPIKVRVQARATRRGLFRMIDDASIMMSEMNYPPILHWI